MKRIPKCFLILAVIPLCFSRVAFPSSFSLASIQQELKWATYFAKGEEFSVQLPEMPSLAVKDRPNKAREARFEGRIYGSYADGIVYLVISENNPKRAEKLDTFTNEFERTLPRHRTKGPSQIIFDRDLYLNGFPGKRYRLKFYNGIDGLVDFYVTNKHVYVIEVAGGDETSPVIKRFLESFSLDENARRKDAALGTKSFEVAPRTATSADESVDQVFSHQEVALPAFAVSRPEPFYTEEARQNQLVGTVVLKAVLTSSGKVANIEVVKGLKYGLTNRAVDAARKLKFIPALKDGRFVSQHIQFEYNFNLY